MLSYYRRFLDRFVKFSKLETKPKEEVKAKGDNKKKVVLPCRSNPQAERTNRRKKQETESTDEGS